MHRSFSLLSLFPEKYLDPSSLYFIFISLIIALANNIFQQACTKLLVLPTLVAMFAYAIDT